MSRRAAARAYYTTFSRIILTNLYSKKAQPAKEAQALLFSGLPPAKGNQATRDQKELPAAPEKILPASAGNPALSRVFSRQTLDFPFILS